MMKFNREEGLTLIELLITISVLAIVSAIALPVINNVVSSSNSNALAQTQSDVADFVAKYNAAGAVGYDKGSQTFQGFVDTDGDNQVDSNELIDTLTIDTNKFVIPQGLYGSFTANYGSGAGTPSIFLAGTNGY
jgi:prepilin-type N-terminal cleavage/methylation domain-containing protein